MLTFSRTSPEISSGISASDSIDFSHAPSCSMKSSGIFCVSLTRITAIGVNSEAAVSIERSPLAVKLHMADLESTYLREKGTSDVR